MFYTLNARMFVYSVMLCEINIHEPRAHMDHVTAYVARGDQYQDGGGWISARIQPVSNYKQDLV